MGWHCDHTSFLRPTDPTSPLLFNFQSILTPSCLYALSTALFNVLFFANHITACVFEIICIWKIIQKKASLCLSKEGVLVSKNVHNRHLNICSPLGSTVSKLTGSTPLLEKICHWGQVLKSQSQAKFTFGFPAYSATPFYYFKGYQTLRFTWVLG